MKNMKIMFIVALSFLYLASIANANIGKAVWYGPKRFPSACYQYQDHGTMVAAVSDALWDNGRACGRRYRVRCIGPANTAKFSCRYGQTVEVTVVDLCRAQCNGIISLYQDAFGRIANTLAGVVRVDFNQI